MADLRFFNRKFASELQSMEVSLEASVDKTAVDIDEYVKKLALASIPRTEIKRLLLEDLKNGGRIFGGFRNAVRATTEGTIGRISTDAYLAEFGTEDIKYTWIAALVRTCEDCLPRHGKIKKFEEWERSGLPRTGWSVCREHCQCVLIPQEMADGRNELSEPLKREPRKSK